MKTTGVTHIAFGLGIVILCLTGYFGLLKHSEVLIAAMVVGAIQTTLGCFMVWILKR